MAELWKRVCRQFALPLWAGCELRNPKSILHIVFVVFKHGIKLDKRVQFTEHTVVLGSFELWRSDEGLHPDFFHGIGQVFCLVHWVNVDQNHSGKCTGELRDNPLVFVWRPNSNSIALLHAQMDQSDGQFFTLNSRVYDGFKLSMLKSHIFEDLLVGLANPVAFEYHKLTIRELKTRFWEFIRHI